MRWFKMIACLVTIAKLWKQPGCPMTDEWNKKMWYIYTMEFYSTIKKNDILLFVGKWMELEIIVLSEVSHTQKSKVTCFPSYVETRPTSSMYL
jgi:hypothetical protein